MENIRLLLVDDEEDFRRAISKRLRKRHLVPKEAASGEQCLAILDKKAMDIVVLDVKMPGMDGIEVLHHIKKRYPKTEVILLTGQATTQDGVDGIKAGAFDYLTKPIEFEHLLGKINQAHEKLLWDEEKRREAEFRAKMEEQMMAAERLASLGTLAVGVAHEINNPLAIINDSVGWMKLLLKREELAEMPIKHDFEMGLDKVEKSIERAKKITHQLLGFVRKSDSVTSEVDLKEFLEEAVGLVSKEAANKNIEIVREIDPSLGPILSDPYQLRQVLINLLANALQATETGGKIFIIIERIGEGIAITVRDTGQGIPKENLKRIFEPFFSTKPPGEGTGLGLFVSRGIIEKLGGTLEVESQLGNGASFRLKLPRCHEPEQDLDKGDRADLLEKVKGVISKLTSKGEGLP